MADVREVWKSIRALPDKDRRWLLAQLVDWPPFQRQLARRLRSSEALREDVDGELRGQSARIDSRMAQAEACSPVIVFDGGSRGNPGPGYGSYALLFADHLPQVVHLEFEDEMTNNEAEYEALICALEDLRGRLTAMGSDPRHCKVTAHGDSRLVINQVTGAWKAREPRMLQRRDRVRQLLRSFGSVSFQQERREKIEEVLGH